MMKSKAMYYVLPLVFIILIMTSIGFSNASNEIEKYGDRIPSEEEIEQAFGIDDLTYEKTPLKNMNVIHSYVLSIYQSDKEVNLDNFILNSSMELAIDDDLHSKYIAPFFDETYNVKYQFGNAQIDIYVFLYNDKSVICGIRDFGEFQVYFVSQLDQFIEEITETQKQAILQQAEALFKLFIK